MYFAFNREAKCWAVTVLPDAEEPITKTIHRVSSEQPPSRAVVGAEEGLAAAVVGGGTEAMVGWPCLNKRASNMKEEKQTTIG